MKQAFDNQPKGSRARLVIWDHRGGDANGLLIEALTSTLSGLRLEHGVCAAVSAGLFLAGEYWQYPARPGAAPMPVAPDGTDTPDGPEHLTAPLLAVDHLKAEHPLRKTFARLALTDNV